MSVIGKKPFIKSLIESLTDEQLETLQTLIDGGGNQTPILRTMSDKPVGNRTNITASDKGVKRCNLQLEYSLFNGYLLYNDTYCVLIYYTDAQVLGMFTIDVDNKELANVTEALTIVELRSELKDIASGGKVEANPELEGNESELSGIEINGIKYKNVPKVTANPELAGSEDDLTSIQIGATKFNVAKPIYKHIITKGSNPAYTMLIYNNSPDKIDNAGKINAAFHGCIAAYFLGAVIEGGLENRDYVLITSSYDGSISQTTLTYIYLDSGNLAVGTYVYSETITDTVTKL